MGLIALAVHGLARWISPRWLLLAGRKSLFVYIAHVLILYSIPFTGKTLRDAIGSTLYLWQVVLLFSVLLFVCLGLAALNERRKRRPT